MKQSLRSLYSKELVISGSLATWRCPIWCVRVLDTHQSDLFACQMADVPGSHGLSVEGTDGGHKGPLIRGSRGPKGIQLEVWDQRASKLL